MKRKLICLLSLIVLAALLLGDDVTDKQKELEKIQRDLQAAELKAAQTESKKKQKESELQNTKQAKSQTDIELRRTQTEASEKLSDLSSVQRQLRVLGNSMEDLKILQNNQMVGLMRLERQNRSLRLVPRDQHILATMAAQTRIKLNELGDVQETLSAEEVLKNREFAQANSKYQKTYTTSKKLDYQVRNLESEKTRLSREQQQLQNQITKLRQDAAQLEALIAQLTAPSEGATPTYRFSSRTIAWPVRGKVIRSFGQETRSYGTSVVCNGIDIAIPEWTSVVAADRGEVVFAGTYGGQGKLVIIDHKNGFFTVYAYNNEIVTSVGAQVKKSQVIAKSGMTGSASVPSLHFELRKDGKAINPMLYLE